MRGGFRFSWLPGKITSAGIRSSAPRSGWFDINLRELAHYRDLIFLLVKRNVTVLYKQTVLGPAWMVIQPVLSSLMFTVVFGGIASLPTDGMPDFLFYMPAISSGPIFPTP